MNICFQFGHGVCNLPERIKEHFKTASGTDFKVLVFFAAHPAYCLDCEKKYKEISQKTGIPADEVAAAVAYWTEKGILVEAGEGAEAAETAQVPEQTKSAEQPPKKAKKAEFPSYSDGEVSALMENNKEIRALTDECQKIVGKIFSAYEISSVVALYDYLKLTPAYIMTLFAYCKRKEKTSMRYIERTAAGLLDEGIDNVKALEEKISAMDNVDAVGGLIRRLYGMGARAFTKEEKTIIDRWVNQWLMSEELIEFAYELMIGYIEKPSLKYANKIITDWHEKGLHTIDEVQAAQEQFRSARGAQKPGGTQPPRRLGEFDVDEFLSLALKRSFE